MALVFKILNGVLKNKIYKISPGLSLGRRHADLNLEDKKVSSFHAEVVENDAQLHLIDRNSRNGLYIDVGRVESVLLELGTKFLIGKTRIEVFEVSPEDPLVADPLETWRAVLTKLNDKLIGELEFPARSAGPLKPALKLTFIRGRQLNTSYVMGYGPRQLGIGSREFPIHEPGMPNICFEIFPNEGSWFKTDHCNEVRLNGKAIAAESLNAGDVIALGETVIEVSFLDD